MLPHGLVLAEGLREATQAQVMESDECMVKHNVWPRDCAVLRRHAQPLAGATHPATLTAASEQEDQLGDREPVPWSSSDG